MNQNTQPLISILVLNYNGKKFLDDCFNSLLNSTYPNQEIIMIDNKSTDDSVDYVTKNYPQVKVFNNGVNGGFSLAYNNGFKIAQGKYFVILNKARKTQGFYFVRRKHVPGKRRSSVRRARRGGRRAHNRLFAQPIFNGARSARARARPVFYLVFP